MHRAVATKHHGYVGQIVGFQRSAAKQADPRIAEGFHDLLFYMGMRNGGGSHREIVPRAGR